MSAMDPKSTERLLVTEWNRGKEAAIAVMDRFYSPDYVIHIATGQDIRGLENEKKHMRDFTMRFLMLISRLMT